MGINLQRLKDTRGIDLTVWPPRYDATYVPCAGQEHWLPEIECADKAERDEIIFRKLVKQVSYAWERSPFYRRLWEQAGVSPATLKSLEDLARFPVVQKAELRSVQESNPPFGDLLCIKPEEVTRIHGTSGTTGRPVVFGLGRDDWERIANAHARIMWGAGLRPIDRIMICSFFSLYVGSWGALIGGERLVSEIAHHIKARQRLIQEDTFVDLEFARKSFQRLMADLISEGVDAIPELPKVLDQLGISHHPAFANVRSAADVKR